MLEAKTYIRLNTVKQVREDIVDVRMNLIYSDSWKEGLRQQVCVCSLTSSLLVLLFCFSIIWFVKLNCRNK